MYRNKYSERIAFRLHTNEKLNLINQANSLKMCLSEYIREKLINPDVKSE